MMKFTHVLLAILFTTIVGYNQSYASEVPDSTGVKAVQSGVSVPKFTYQFSGRVHKSLMMVNDGGGSLEGPYVMDSDQSPSRLKLLVQNRDSSPFFLGANIEVGLHSKRPTHISQEQANPEAVIRIMASELTFGHEKYGYIDLGIGLTSSTMFLESDLSGIANSNLLTVGLASQGLYFRDRETGELSDTQIVDYYYTPGRMLITDRIRYRSPILFDGFQIQGGVATDGKWDAAARYFKTFEHWDFRSYVSYEHTPSVAFSGRGVLGLSAKHHASGLSVSSLFSKAGATENNRNPNSYIIRLGLERNWWKYGSTSFTIDYGEGRDIRTYHDKIESVGAFVQQKITPLNFDVYAGFRKYTVYSPEENLLPIQTATLGMIFIF
ncbi:hypothetical protein [Flammeovirga sp. EKP202]|uniref:hypothetical protein n=1 Tax=Flammeovirga sp. EKP202 TaxID=2770592 RepID=UPI00165ECD20|nr:hypothetical protein [Flammeovirga sp. EKP202]MBD0399953.1 hypothetical protein [Flammeovirga sp. EKP202]